MKLLTIIGTRPEAIKMAPVLRALQRLPELNALLATTGQHRDLIQAPLSTFGLCVDLDLRLQSDGDDPLKFVAHAVPRIARMLEEVRPDRVIVQGDTASALAGAEAAATLGIGLSHIEAGLRTHSALPWPEEPFRKRIDALADHLFAPTPRAAANLRAEGLAGAIHVTGNSGIDALQELIARAGLLATHNAQPMLLVTLHRRENIGDGAANLCRALRQVAAAADVRVVFALHPNPRVSAPIRAALGDIAQITLLPPQEPMAMLRLMQESALILTDSGGLQEEAPSLGKPVLILRDVTERPEGVDAGVAMLVGTRPDAILAGIDAMLRRGATESVANPYGDGRAAERIVAAICGEPYEPFEPPRIAGAGPASVVEVSRSLA